MIGPAPDGPRLFEVEEMSQFVTRSDFGGPSVPGEYRTELTRIIEQMQEVPLAYAIEVMLYVGGDFLEITDPTGVSSTRVSVKKKTAGCVIQMNNRDVLDASDPAAFMRATFHDALVQVIDRIAARDGSVDATAEKARVAFLGQAG